MADDSDPFRLLGSYPCVELSEQGVFVVVTLTGTRFFVVVTLTGTRFFFCGGYLYRNQVLLYSIGGSQSQTVSQLIVNKSIVGECCLLGKLWGNRTVDKKCEKSHET